jgi:DNA-directed RNA polymerase subunit M/transcription elongation factor TFIIS
MMKLHGEIICPDCGEVMYKKFDRMLGCYVYVCYRCNHEECIYNKELEEEY